MNYQHFQYPPVRDVADLAPPKPAGNANPASNHHLLRSTTPSSSALAHHLKPQPLRVTTEAIEPLFFALAFTIEYSLTVGKKDGPLAIFSPRISSSDILNVTYVEVETHNQALLEALSRATAAAKQLPFRDTTVQFKLRIRVSRNIPSTKGFFGFLGGGPQKHVIAMWEFGIIKTRTEVMTQQTGGASFSFQSPVSQMNVPLTAAGHHHYQHPNRHANLTTASQAASPNSADDSQHNLLGAVSVYSNDPVEIRQALHHIVKNTFTAIDAEWYKELRVGDLIYEVDVLER
ncbi:Hypothetical protein, putative [Bodo saltans]|uniref:Uncharacterized protein n=1 Tax=Bodo saltans TaxID=75058 RepID=A0A0S4JP18_BODSA|nr:Hypothetical protein, putative [Bodo saltans]|eukprot:CUG93287.1 Hypothetical protein, putative [Bodo saltans]